MTLIPLRHGAALNVDIGSGPAGAPALVMLHGFTGSTSSWARLMETWRDQFTTVAIDAMGHGQSSTPRDPNRYTMQNVVADTLNVLDILNIKECFLAGYSMGGRMALHIALDAPHRIKGLILESATPGIRTEAEKVARLASDEKWATLLEKEGIEAFVNHWEQLPLFATQRHLPADVLQAQRERRLKNSPKGLAASLRGAGTAAQDNQWDRLSSLAIPTLLLAGELDVKFSTIARDMHTLIPDSRLEIVQNVGHAVHLEAPETYRSLVEGFIRAHEEEAVLKRA